MAGFALFVIEAVGAYVLGQVLGPDTPERPKGPTALRTSARDEGDPTAWGMGSECLVPAGIMWYGPLKTTTGGGKGGGGKGARTTKYTADVALSFMNRPTSLMRKLWIGGDLIYNSTTAIAFTGTSMTAFQHQETFSVPGPNGIPIQTTLEFLDMASADITQDLSILVPGFDATVGGWDNSNNNGVMRVAQAYRNANGSSFARLLKSSGNAVDESGAGDTITITETTPLFSTGRVQAVTYFNGSGAQNPWSVMEAVEGTGNVPGFRGRSYVGLQQLNVTKWGASLPDCRALIQESASRMLDEVVSEICLRSKRLTANDIDVTALAGIPVRGIVALGPTPGSSLLKQLDPVYDLAVQDRQGKLVFYLASAPDTIVIPVKVINTTTFGEIPTSRSKKKTIPRASLATNLAFGYIDPERDWQEGEELWPWKPELVNSTQQVKVDMTLTRQEAAKIVKKLGTRITLKTEELETMLPANYVDVIEGDNLLLTDNEGDLAKRYRTTLVDRGDDGLIRIEAIPEQLESFTQAAEVEGGSSIVPIGGGGVTFPAVLDTFLVDLPPQNDNDVLKVGLYYAAGTTNPTTLFVGCTLLRSVDGGASYQIIENLFLEAITGVTSGTLGTVASAQFFDAKNTITVILHSDNQTLSSVTAVDVLAGANRILIGLEVLGYTTATLTAERTYLLSGLFRGMNGTDNFISSHFVNEPCLILDNNALLFVNLGVSAFNQDALYKNVPAGGLIADYPPIAIRTLGRSAQPLDPYNVKGARPSTGAQDLTISWSLRTRASYTTLSGSIPQVVDALERYEIDILNNAETAVLRTITVTGATSTVYTEAQQGAVTDFGGGGPHTNIHMNIYQIGDIVGRGRAAHAILL